jgi:hypothetical protein
MSRNDDPNAPGTGGSAILTELFVVASALKYSGIAGHSPAGLWVNSIATVAAAVAQPPCLAAIGHRD